MVPTVPYVVFVSNQMSINPPSGQLYGIINTSGIFPSNVPWVRDWLKPWGMRAYWLDPSPVQVNRYLSIQVNSNEILLTGEATQNAAKVWENDSTPLPSLSHLSEIQPALLLQRDLLPAPSNRNCPWFSFIDLIELSYAEYKQDPFRFSMDTSRSSMSALKGWGCKPIITLKIGQCSYPAVIEHQAVSTDQSNAAEPAPTAAGLFLSLFPPPCWLLLGFSLPHTDIWNLSLRHQRRFLLTLPQQWHIFGPAHHINRTCCQTRQLSNNGRIVRCAGRLMGRSPGNVMQELQNTSKTQVKSTDPSFEERHVVCGDFFVSINVGTDPGMGLDWVSKPSLSLTCTFPWAAQCFLVVSSASFPSTCSPSFISLLEMNDGLSWSSLIESLKAFQTHHVALQPVQKPSAAHEHFLPWARKGSL